MDSETKLEDQDHHQELVKSNDEFKDDENISNDEQGVQFYASGPLWCEEGTVPNELFKLSPSKASECLDGSPRAGASSCNVLYLHQNPGSSYSKLCEGNYSPLSFKYKPKRGIRESCRSENDKFSKDDINGFWCAYFGEKHTNVNNRSGNEIYYISSEDSFCNGLMAKNGKTISSPTLKSRKFNKIAKVKTSNSGQTVSETATYTTVLKPKAIRPRLATFPMSYQSNCEIASVNCSYCNSLSHDQRGTGKLNQSPLKESLNCNLPFDNPSATTGRCKNHPSKTLSVDNLKDFTETSYLVKGKVQDMDKISYKLACRSGSQNQETSREPIHMTLEEVRNSLENFVDNSALNKSTKNLPKNSLLGCKKRNGTCPATTFSKSFLNSQKIKTAFANIFKTTKRKIVSPSPSDKNKMMNSEKEDKLGSPFVQRALPPLPSEKEVSGDEEIDENLEERRKRILDYAASIERVKDCGWYWGPISGPISEKLLENEPDGSFIVRDSSDEHYIFSLTFKLNGLVRHVRIEHDQGNFSFGSLQKYRSNTIVDFIENAVEHSRSGRYLFFLHRRPVMGPMRVQLLHPVSRFKQIQTLQHTCRFIILKYVRRDLIDQLPLPVRLKSYLNTPYYYSEIDVNVERQ